ncbi:hypothetical protein GCM10027399_14900 [Curvibacter fontanus]
MHRHILTLLIFPLALLASPVRASDNDATRTAPHLLDFIAVDDGGRAGRQGAPPG